MTPLQKIKWAILQNAIDDEYVDISSTFEDEETTDITKDNVDDLFDVYCGDLQDIMYEFREGEVETKLPCDYSRHYESKSVAAKIPDGSWVGWTYWYGGGKHGEPEAIDWMQDAYDLKVTEEEKLVIVRTFTK
jgi:hypothetical protein